jgi:hypothetical protein
MAVSADESIRERGARPTSVGERGGRRASGIGGGWRVKRNEMDGDRGDATLAVGCESGVTFNFFDRFEAFSSN